MQEGQAGRPGCRAVSGSVRGVGGWTGPHWVQQLQQRLLLCRRCGAITAEWAMPDHGMCACWVCRSPASAESKARTQQRKKDRATMAAYKGSLLGGGGEHA